MTDSPSFRLKVLLLTYMVIFFLCIINTYQCSAEQLLSLEQAIEIALEDGYEMKSLRLQLMQAEENRLAAKYRFRTNADMIFNTPSWSERVSSVQVPDGLPVYNSLGTLRYRGQLNINQPLPTDGRISLRSELYQSRESNYLANKDETLKRNDFLTSLRIYMTQPLFTYNRLKTGLQRAELNYENTSLATKRTQLNVIYDVTNSFFSLYQQTRICEIARETLEREENAYKLAQLKYEAGLIPEVDALRTEVNLSTARSNLLESEARMEFQKEFFKQQIGLDLADDIGVNTDIAYKHFDIDMEKAISEGLAHRTEIRETEIAIELSRINIKETDALNEVRADLTAFYDLTGFSDSGLSLVTGTQDLFDSSWDDLQRRPGNRGVTLTFSLPIWDWGVNKAQVASARADLRRTELRLEEEKKTIINSITDAVRRVRTAESRLTVLQKSQEVAQRAYDISLERFNNGEITSQDLALDNENLSSAKLAFLGAYISYQLAGGDLKRKTMWDFVTNRPVM